MSRNIIILWYVAIILSKKNAIIYYKLDIFLSCNDIFYLSLTSYLMRENFHHKKTFYDKAVIRHHFVVILS